MEGDVLSREEDRIEVCARRARPSAVVQGLLVPSCRRTRVAVQAVVDRRAEQVGQRRRKRRRRSAEVSKVRHRRVRLGHRKAENDDVMAAVQGAGVRTASPEESVPSAKKRLTLDARQVLGEAAVPDGDRVVDLEVDLDLDAVGAVVLDGERSRHRL